MAIPIKINSVNLIAEYNYNSLNDTCICGEKLKDTNKEVIKNSCNHCFHNTCISQLIFIDNSCPICKASWINSKNIFDNNILLYKD